MACRQCEELSANVVAAFESLKTATESFRDYKVASSEELDALESARRRYREAFERFEIHLREHRPPEGI